MKLLCLDLDGTLLNSQRTISPNNVAAVAAASHAGFAIVLCTCRGPSTHLPAIKELGLQEHLYVVGHNGAVVYRAGADGSVQQTLFEAALSAEQVRWVVGLSAGRPMKLDVGDEQIACCGHGQQRGFLDAHSALVGSEPRLVPCLELEVAPQKATIFTPDPQGLVLAAAGGILGDGLSVVVGGPYWVETRVRDKACGVRLLCEELGVELDACVYFGDGASDAGALRLCGLGVAMAHAGAEARRAADRVSIWGCDGDAVARELEALLPADAAQKVRAGCMKSIFHEADPEGTGRIAKCKLLALFDRLVNALGPADFDKLLNASGAVKDADVDYEAFVEFLYESGVQGSPAACA